MCNSDILYEVSYIYINSIIIILADNTDDIHIYIYIQIVILYYLIWQIYIYIHNYACINMYDLYIYVYTFKNIHII